VTPYKYRWSKADVALTRALETAGDDYWDALTLFDKLVMQDSATLGEVVRYYFDQRYPALDEIKTIDNVAP
jgi:hypothetical protein